eukprot:scaffold5478_cov161-Amphora_coffeaeformis.AAC.9
MKGRTFNIEKRERLHPISPPYYCDIYSSFYYCKTPNMALNIKIQDEVSECCLVCMNCSLEQQHGVKQCERVQHHLKKLFGSYPNHIAAGWALHKY